MGRTLRISDGDAIMLGATYHGGFKVGDVVEKLPYMPAAMTYTIESFDGMTVTLVCNAPRCGHKEKAHMSDIRHPHLVRGK